MITDPAHQDEAIRLLKQSSMFHACKDDVLRKVVKDMDRIDFVKGDVLCQQGDPQDRAFFIADGQIRRERLVNDRSHQVVDTFGNTDPDQYGNRKIAIGALHVLKKEPSFALAKCMSNGVLYSLPSDVLHKHLHDATFSTRPKKTNVIAVSLAASVESFYRSGLNAAMNARLSGQWGKLFPNMHIQVLQPPEPPEPPA